ncbi:hypothetical protein [Zhaonella formicivorans]|uniref:hypothetical protein n=1 Tax=Zhaonella formicivorans TaxID=2528593 RepID=UPI0010D58D29|nr:hypothetical protein [Zhaonella formicivorans]
MVANRDLDCPLCNGTERVTGQCPVCGNGLEDGGILENFFGPYSPYEEVAYQLQDFPSESELDRCMHLVYCPVCGWDTRVGIRKIPLE